MAENNSSAPLKTAEGVPVAQWQKRHPDEEGGAWQNTNRGDAMWWRDNSQGWEIRALYEVAPQAVEAQAPAAVPWENFPCYLIDHCEGDVITEEGLQHALAAMLANPQYSAATPAHPATEDSSAGDLAAMTHGEAAAALAINSALHRIRAGNPADAIEPLQHALHALAQAEVQAEPVLCYLKVAATIIPGGGYQVCFPKDRGAFPVYAAPQAQPADALDDTKLLNFLRDECCDLRCDSSPTGGEDSEVYWKVIEHHMAKPHEREIGRSYSVEPRQAIRAAMAAGYDGALANHKGKA